MAATTRTGGFEIGFRRGWSDWQRDLSALIGWAKEGGFACIDLGPDAYAVRAVVDAGLAVGSVDLPQWKGMIAADAATRDTAVEENLAFIERVHGSRVSNYFVVMQPENPELERKENFDYMTDSYVRLMPVLKKYGSRLVIEGWPGQGVLCCTPETCRAFFDAMDSPAAGVNYDPSHLMRMGIDPLRFLEEFVDRVGHVHAKDTELFGDRQYEFGHEQPPTFATSPDFGGPTWRYTVPGQGAFRWSRGLQVLADADYT